jgi:NAD-dependent DNA ligase
MPERWVENGLNKILEKDVKDPESFSSISGQTDYLVVGKEPGKKLDEAENETSVRIINEVKFREILEKGSS